MLKSSRWCTMFQPCHEPLAWRMLCSRRPLPPLTPTNCVEPSGMAVMAATAIGLLLLPPIAAQPPDCQAPLALRTACHIVALIGVENVVVSLKGWPVPESVPVTVIVYLP